MGNYVSPSYPGQVFLYQTPPLPLPQTANKTLFTFNAAGNPGGGGRAKVLSIVGLITTAIGAVANATKLTAFTYTAAGVINTGVDMCATLDINALTADEALNISGTLASAMLNNAYGVLIAQATAIDLAF